MRYGWDVKIKDNKSVHHGGRGLNKRQNKVDTYDGLTSWKTSDCSQMIGLFNLNLYIVGICLKQSFNKKPISWNPTSSEYKVIPCSSLKSLLPPRSP